VNTSRDLMTTTRKDGVLMSERSERIDKYSAVANAAAERSEVCS